ncbi:MAG: biopolymer transporter ExbD [Oxalobacter sp.]|nr:biopolymer transporter ExbD [Oxalobacter sp.]
MKNSFDEKGGLTEINMVPLIDVMLVLVVILLMSAVFVVPNPVARALNVSLPTAQGESVASSPIQVELDAKGRLSVDGREIALPDLAAALAAVPKDRPVLLAADRDVTMQPFVTVMDALKRAGFTKISVRIQR